MQVRHSALALILASVSLAHAQKPPRRFCSARSHDSDKRAYGVLPNNRSAEASDPFKALTVKQKLTIAAKDSFDGAVYPTAAIFSVVYQAENQNPSFGQGIKGYANGWVALLATR